MIPYFVALKCEDMLKKKGGIISHVLDTIAKCLPGRTVVCAGSGKVEVNGVTLLGSESLEEVLGSPKGPRFISMYTSFAKVVKDEMRKLGAKWSLSYVPGELRQVALVSALAPTTVLFLGDTQVEVLNSMNPIARRVLVALEPFLATRAVSLYALSALDVKRWMSDKWWLGLERSFIVYQGLPKTTYEFVQRKYDEIVRKKSRDVNGNVTFYAYGVMLPKRDYHLLVAASKMLLDEDFDFRVIVRTTYYGEEAHKLVNIISEMITELGVSDVVNFEASEEPLAWEDVVRLHLENDILLWTDRIAAYGITPLEANAFGNPAIISDGCGVAELLNFDPNSTFRAREYRDLYRAMKKYLTNDMWKKRRPRLVEKMKKMNLERTCRQLRTGLAAVLR